MKDLNYGVGDVLSKCKRIKSAFVENTEIIGDIISRSLMLTLQVENYAKMVNDAISSVGISDFAGERVKVGI